MLERYMYEYVTDISLSVCYICSTNIDLSVSSLVENSVIYKTFFLLDIQCAMCTFCALMPTAGYILVITISDLMSYGK
jgi:hypothetical protein